MEATRVRWSTVENMVSTQWTSTGLCRWKKCFKNKSNPDQWLNLLSLGFEVEVAFNLAFAQDCEQCGSYNHMIDICPHRWKSLQPLQDILAHIFWGILISLYQSPARTTAGTRFAKMERNWSATSVALMITCSRFPSLIMIPSSCTVPDNDSIIFYSPW